MFLYQTYFLRYFAFISLADFLTLDTTEIGSQSPQKKRQKNNKNTRTPYTLTHTNSLAWAGLDKEMTYNVCIYIICIFSAGPLVYVLRSRFAFSFAPQFVLIFFGYIFGYLLLCSLAITKASSTRGFGQHTFHCFLVNNLIE